MWGEVLPALSTTWKLLPAPQGLIVYCPSMVSEAEVLRHVHGGTLGLLLGYGVPAKPAGADQCVVIRDADGQEKQSVVVDEETRQAALEAAAEVKDATDRISIESAEKTMTGRLNALQRHECLFVPYQPDRHAAALESLIAAHPTAFKPVGVTHVVMRNRNVIGWLGLNSLPFYRMSIPVTNVTVQDVLGLVRVVENQYRMVGTQHVATLFDVDCRSYPYKERLGYMEMADWRIALKQLL